MRAQVYGCHAVMAVLQVQPETVESLWLVNPEQRQDFAELARDSRIPVHEIDRKSLDEWAGEGNHQGVLIRLKKDARPRYTEKSIEQLLVNQPPVILAIDDIEDPRNFGACIRTANAAGVGFIVVPKNRGAPVTELVEKVACGATLFTPIVEASNFVRALGKLRDEGYWIVGLAGEAETSLFDYKFDAPHVIVMGSESNGLRHLTRKSCDTLLNIPMRGVVSSLNVSVATGVALFEALKAEG